MNLPNALTIFRILALPLCAWALFKNGGDDSTWRVIAWLMFFVVGMTDVLDGKIARSRNQISPLGIILDPIADKAFIATALIGLSILDRIPWWVTTVILTRELSVTILRFVVIKREIISANRGGKFKTLIQNFSVGFYILPLPENLFLPRDILLGVAMYLTITTGIQYFKSALRR
ncbi:MAG: CDP-diacylglycerol--glycerol-3-phosphate 3-phosphatidyltransferase [Actinobacteria bacterium]|jgi:CDP-diacylglycerol--glycerol-3-phosphate 3-phosphatidyltransferase|nr:CDP-diacylglycerol--glycerol-3-phosphate 3-phosphatidyltransferase [Actinomycetota bacterium]NCW34485.1 CDP-diacylglycerol--glycerol-3-phosphate 3-phosphatidyltransferase [Actinomycetota bacterium]NCZ73419.1 CDP-diacylglycerol--glycerol-3-phosphate 3-phosphatidyltransferase [Actinomycetota bacterium]NDA41473.1 CDP-diacylglycerol--glycerol-3-phosphate 3-phosphatidyltransferase [Actinomycetota bacterium]NDB30939.1 CDP-diacylglycerol--glycerol-3-phosphate 3-phosphatidyltransferase [Actinomyceto